MSDWQMIHGDCLEVMRGMPECSVDAVVTDPPYELNFMGRKWDGTGIAYNVDLWSEAMRVLKPGGYLLAFGGTRTYHRMAVTIEDAGFLIHPMLGWIFGSGFPKATNLSKRFDAEAGAERRIVGTKLGLPGYSLNPNPGNGVAMSGNVDRSLRNPEAECAITAPATDAAKQWDGWFYGRQSLKPAIEPICMAQKPVTGRMTDNVLRWGTGAINVDGCRVPGAGIADPNARTKKRRGSNDVYGKGWSEGGEPFIPSGRWPANVVLDEAAALALDEQSGERKSPKPYTRASGSASKTIYGDYASRDGGINASYGDTGTASRFYYVAKASRAERNAGLGSTCTVKYNLSREEAGLCEATVRLLEKATCDIPTVKWLTGESGASITALCPSDSLSITLTAIRRITTSLTSPSLTPSRTNGFTADASYATANGGSPAGSAESSSPSAPTTTLERAAASAPGAEHVASKMLSLISDEDAWKPATNIHSTVKPLALMRWLVRLVTPPDGLVLDPFAGSGSTGCACVLESFRFIGIEQDAEYVDIARARIAHHAEQARQLALTGD